jgi:topoisomerase IV subunit A
MGNIMTKYPVKKVIFKSAGVSTLGGVEIWYDDTIGRLNRDEHGRFLGNFEAKDLILVLYNNGSYELTNFELTNRYEPKEIASLSKFSLKSVITAVHFDAASKNYFVKRFRIETSTVDKTFSFISEGKTSKLIYATIEPRPVIELATKKDDKSPTEKTEVYLEEAVEIRGWKAIGAKLSGGKVQNIKVLASREALPEDDSTSEVEEIIETEALETEATETESTSTAADQANHEPTSSLTIENNANEVETELKTRSIPLEIQSSNGPTIQLIIEGNEPTQKEKLTPKPPDKKEKKDPNSAGLKGEQLGLF